MKKVMLMMSIMLFSSFSYAGWYAEAHSRSASGWAEAYDKQTAQQVALRECAIRTPSWDTCFITTVFWIN